MISTLFLQDLERYLLSKGYKVFNGEPNLAALEGLNIDGTLNSDAPDLFNDLFLIWDHLDGKPRLLGNYVCTTEPGRFYTDRPLNPNGAARLKFDQYTAWAIGFHQNKRDHEALVQVRPVTVHRDRNRDMSRPGDPLDTGLFGINVHHGYDTNPRGSIGKHSAGCIVLPRVNDLRALLGHLKRTPQYQRNRNHVWTISIVAGDEFTRFRSQPRT